MKKRVLAMLLAVTMVSGCSSVPAPQDQNASAETTKSDDEGKEEKKEDQTQAGTEVQSLSTGTRTSLLGDEEVIYYDPNLVPSIPAYSVNPDFSNVVYNANQAWTLGLEYQSEYNDVESLRKALVDKNFAVQKYGSNEFFDIYEGNRYSQIPNFITVDSLMHTYHLYFAYLMKTCEKD